MNKNSEHSKLNHPSGGMAPSVFMDQLRIRNTESGGSSESLTPSPENQLPEESADRPDISRGPALHVAQAHEDNNDHLLEKEREPHGTMPPEARRALVSLMRHGVILYSRKPKLFEALCRHGADVRRHLSEVYLKLILDEKAGVAFVSVTESEHGQAPGGEEDGEEESETVSLISRRTLSLYDTLLLLVLRKHYQNRELCGEQKIVIDTERMESDLSPFLPLTNSSRADRKKLNAALTRMVKNKILSTVRGNKDRFEITPVIRYVVGADFLESMLAEYTRMAKENQTVSTKPDRHAPGDDTVDLDTDQPA